jgi:hypothetical protein
MNKLANMMANSIKDVVIVKLAEEQAKQDVAAQSKKAPTPPATKQDAAGMGAISNTTSRLVSSPRLLNTGLAAANMAAGVPIPGVTGNDSAPVIRQPMIQQHRENQRDARALWPNPKDMPAEYTQSAFSQYPKLHRALFNMGRQ